MLLGRDKLTSLSQSRQVGLPAVIAGVLVGIAMIVYGIVAPPNAASRLLTIASGVFGGAYALAFTRILIPMGLKHPGIWWLVALAHSMATVWLLHLDSNNLPGVSLLTFFIFLMASAVLMGRWPAYFFVSLTTVTYLIVKAFSPSNVTNTNYGMIMAIILTSAVVIETVNLFQNIIQHQVRRLEILNKMTRSLAYSIEMKQVISLMSGAIQSTLNADTYLIGFLEGDEINLELFYDENEFFQSVRIPLRGTLAGKVIEQRNSLFLCDMTKQLPETGLPNHHVLGKPRPSLSWMGTPLQVHHNVFGVAAVASYRKNAFTTADLDLLESFAQQASIALDNASHHADVEQKSTQDSLTRVLNHGNFLEALEHEAQKVGRYKYPLSLIMLDVDYFKNYNDQFGHIVGDQVLVRLADLVRRHIKATDLIGRWGGEEFAIALPNTNLRQATVVAERIRMSLHKMEFIDRNGTRIPSPTISQGIAEYPIEACDVEALVDTADQRLYVAKERGRDQIEPPLPLNLSMDVDTHVNLV